MLFVFDPTSSAVLLLGGDKQDNWKGWSREAIPRADVLYDEYLEATKDEGNKK